MRCAKGLFFLVFVGEEEERKVHRGGRGCGGWRGEEGRLQGVTCDKAVGLPVDAGQASGRAREAHTCFRCDDHLRSEERREPALSFSRTDAVVVMCVVDTAGKAKRYLVRVECVAQTGRWFCLGQEGRDIWNRAYATPQDKIKNARKKSGGKKR